MKMRLLLTIVGLTIGLAVPALAQENNTVDPEVRQQIEASIVKFDEATTKMTRLLSQPYIRRTRLRRGDGRRVLIQFPVGKPSNEGMHSTCQFPANSQATLFRCMQSATIYARSLNSIVCILKGRATL